MARPLRIEYPGAFYHITSRGNEQKEIFKNERDFEKFLAYLETAVQRYKAVIHVYCLMSSCRVGFAHQLERWYVDTSTAILKAVGIAHPTN